MRHHSVDWKRRCDQIRCIIYITPWSLKAFFTGKAEQFSTLVAMQLQTVSIKFTYYLLLYTYISLQMTLKGTLYVLFQRLSVLTIRFVYVHV